MPFYFPFIIAVAAAAMQRETLLCNLLTEHPSAFQLSSTPLKSHAALPKTSTHDLSPF
jgi:hypothetical protein